MMRLFEDLIWIRYVLLFIIIIPLPGTEEVQFSPITVPNYHGLKHNYRFGIFREITTWVSRNVIRTKKHNLIIKLD